MFRRLSLSSLLLSALVLPFTGCSSNSGLDSIAISSGAQSVVAGATAQFTASGTYGSSSHLSTRDITSSVTWTSSNTGVATISASGLVTAVAAGTTTITASATGYKGPLTATATVTVTASSGTGATGGSVTSLAVVPSAQTALAVGQTLPFSAIGTTSAGATEVLTTSVTWTSSGTAVATIGASTGIATAVASGTATITASYTNTTSGSVVTGTAIFTVTGASATADITSLTLTPGSESLSASGQTGQLIALGTVGGVQEDKTNSTLIKWSSNIPSIATVSASGLVTGVNAGTATIVAEYTNSDSSVATGTATVTITATPAPEPILGLTIIPASLTVDNLQDTGQFLAIGTFSNPPYVRDVTNSLQTTWISSFPENFPVDTNCTGTQTGTTCAGNSGASAGLVTAYGSGGATIIAESASPDGTIQTATATFNCPFALPNPGGTPPTPGTCDVGNSGPLLATLTVYNEGLNTTNWLITAPSATGTQDVIHCGPGWTADGKSGGSVCTATYPVGTPVTLTAPAQTGVAFGGWSDNCTAIGTVTATGPNSCTVTLTTTPPTVPGDNPGSVNATVGAIFN